MSLAEAIQHQPAESATGHSRLLKCALVVEESRDYWRHIGPFQSNPGETRTDSQAAFNEYWFGARSENWVKEIMLNMRERYEAYPAALEVLAGWTTMLPVDRTIICDWHCQLADMHYRRFTGEYLVERREALRPEVYRQSVINWVTENISDSWTMITRTRMAGNLLSTAFSGGLVKSKRDPRPLAYPTVTDEALTYLLYILRDIDFKGTSVANAYLASVGLYAYSCGDFGICCALDDLRCESPPSSGGMCLHRVAAPWVFRGPDSDGDNHGDGEVASQATPLSRQFVYLHEREPAYAYTPDVTSAWGLGGREAYLNIDSDSGPYPAAQRLFSTSLAPNNPGCSEHQAMGPNSCQPRDAGGKPAILPAWRHAMTAELGPLSP